MAGELSNHAGMVLAWVKLMYTAAIAEGGATTLLRPQDGRLTSMSCHVFHGTYSEGYMLAWGQPEQLDL